MDSSFNMDFILGNPIPRRNRACISGNGGQHSWISENMVVEDKEERMLPDSSLSPSNQTFLSYMMDENKLSDTECIKLSSDKSNVNADVSLYNKHCRLVIDSKGDEYLVAETHLVPIVEACKDLFDNPISSHSKECTITTTCNSVSSPKIVESKIDDRVYNDNNGGPILESFLYASQLALVEVKLKDLEKELSNLDRHSFSQFVNSATNLRNIAGQTFVSQVNEAGTGNFVASDTEVSDMDDVRRVRLGQIITKHSELKKWLSKIKKRLKEKNVSKLCHIVDYSSREQSQLPLPDYLENRSVTPYCQSAFDHHDLASSSDDDNLSETTKEQSHRLHRLSQLIDHNSRQEIEDENGNIIGGTKTCSQAASKDGSDPEGIPNLSYEYESCRDSDINYKEAKSSFDDQVVSTDSECPNNQSPPTPDLRRAELDSNDISEGIRVLVVQKDYLRAGVIHLTNNEGTDQRLWRVTIDGDRKCQDIVISEWQLLEQGVREVIPTSISQLCHGSRVCANWSVQLPMNLYPGTINVSSVDDFPSLNKLPIDFDDGDQKDVDLDQVRLLPENFPNLHELMKASHFVDSNFYSLDRKNRIKKKRLNRLLGTNDARRGFKGKRGRLPITQMKKTKTIKKVEKKKKIIVKWKLIKKNDTGPNNYELVRNIDNLCIGGGDNVQLLSYSRHNYMANVVSVLARHQSSIMEIEFNWYYILSDVLDHSDIIKQLKKSTISKKVIFETSHSDVNDVYSVLRKVEVLSFSEYRMKYLIKCGKKAVPSDSYVMAGKYDQRKKRVESLDEGLRHFMLSGGGD